MLPQDPNPFSQEAIGSLTPLPLPTDSSWHGFRFEKSLETGLLRLNEDEQESLPSLKADLLALQLEDVPLPDLTSPPSTSASESEDDFHSLEDPDAGEEALDIWVLPEVHARTAQCQVLTWDGFLDKHHEEPLSAYISEAGPRLFSLTMNRERGDAVRYVQPDVLLDSLLSLCMGYDSVLYKHDQQKGIFVAQWADIAQYGYSTVLMQDYFRSLAEIGSLTRQLQAFCAANDTKPGRQLHVALLSACRSIVSATQSFQVAMKSKLNSLLQLKAAAQKIRTMLILVEQCTKLVENMETSGFVSALLRQVGEAVDSHGSHRRILQALLARTLRPVLAQISAQIGLGMTQSNTADADLFVDSLIEPGTTQQFREAQSSLQHLIMFAPNTPLLSKSALPQPGSVTIELAFTLADIINLKTQAHTYETTVQPLVTSSESSVVLSMTMPHPVVISLAAERPDLDAFDPFSFQVHHPSKFDCLDSDTSPDDLAELVTKSLEGFDNDDQQIPLDVGQCINLSIRPLIATQYRLLSYSVLRVLFHDHDLLRHLNMQRQYHLLGNPVFSTRLSTALFDPSQHSGEGLRRTGAVTGLRLHSRDTWPPAGSELRLVLMTILSESLSSQDRHLEENISFAIRDMPVEELEKCRDVDSIHALDFLRLRYTPSNALVEAVVTPASLDKYDRVFQHLLSTTRLQAVSLAMLRQNAGRSLSESTRPSDHRLILEMHHFVTTIANYYHNTAIYHYWTGFENVVKAAQNHIKTHHYDDTLHAVKSLDHLRVLHESTLDSIMQALLLKRKQSNTLKILEEVFNTMLKYSSLRARQTETTAANELGGLLAKKEDNTEQLKTAFRSAVARFLEALQSECQARARAGVNDNGQASIDPGDVPMLESLLLHLDMSGYWSRKNKIQRGVDFLPLRFA